MVADRHRGPIGDVGNDVVLDGDTFEVVEDFVYLETLSTCDNDVTHEVKGDRSEASNNSVEVIVFKSKRFKSCNYQSYLPNKSKFKL